MSDPDLRTLERRIDELIQLADALSRENRALRAQQRNWLSERADLVEKNELAKRKIEAMIQRLKSLEQEG